MSDVKATEKETVKFHGTLKSSFNYTVKDDNGNVSKSQNVVSMFMDGLTVDGDGRVQERFDQFYDGKAKKWIPDWYKEKKDYFTVKSAYNVPVRIESTDERLSFAEWVERGNIRGAVVTLKCNVKESALYPSAMSVESEGEPYDAFADF